MARPKNPVPSLLRHKASGQAVFHAGGRDFYCGPFGTPAATAEYRRLIQELLAGRLLPPAGGAGGRTPGPATNTFPALYVPGSTSAGASVAEVLLAFLTFATDHYRGPDGTPTNELKEVKLSLRPVREMYAASPAADFGPLKLRAVREDMIRRGWCRTLINRRVDRIRRAFKWAASVELVPAAVYDALRTVPGLQAGRSAARESERVKPVAEAVYAATLPHLPRLPRAVAELQRWTGMRPGEACGLRVDEVEAAGPVWFFRPAAHKNAHRGRGRFVPIGPKGQQVLRGFAVGRAGAVPGLGVYDVHTGAGRLALADVFEAAGRGAEAELLRRLGPVAFFAGGVFEPGAFVFDPARDRLDRFAAMRRARKSKVTPSQVNRKAATPKRVPGTRFTPLALAHAVRKAAETAGVTHWHPNQLRHLRGTEVRAEFGLEAAQVLLGHARADVTQVYAERDEGLATDVARRAG